ncbi:cytidine deaminase [Sphingobium sp. B11D3B]|uniref:cytidine deaminase n=1 Tax=Sphingobium sp. B11D3B TaxID=2940575 RepID=UPI002227F045|nr:cytidine deaminase [Sphingobium sp. B11D3B]MCW2390246.1 cytidine deaminase [Sphingobium sp. B11D3B]
MSNEATRQDLTAPTPDERTLIDAARVAMARAHAPYSRFAVGAALRLTDGTILTGANFENASYGLSLCAETVAIAAANAQGRLRDIAAIAVTGGAMGGGDGGIITPCGRCRQIIKEAQDMGGRPLAILCATPDGGAVLRLTLDALLPHAFGPANLGIGPG